MSNITIYHNPACGTSRNTLEMIRNSGTEPNVIHYLETPPSRDELVKLIADIGITVRALGNDSNLLIVFYVQIMPDDFVMQLHRF